MRLPLVLRAALAALLPLLLAQLGAAQPAQPSPAAPVLPVFIASDVALDRAVVAEALATMPSLGLVIVAEEPVPAAPSVLVDATGAEVRVRYRRATGAELTRTLTPPTDPSEAAEAVALVIINLVHDETGDLLSLLAPREDGESRGAADASEGEEAPEAARVTPESSVVPEHPAARPPASEASPTQAPPAPARAVSEPAGEAPRPRPPAAPRLSTACTEPATGQLGWTSNAMNRTLDGATPASKASSSS